MKIFRKKSLLGRFFLLFVTLLIATLLTAAAQAAPFRFVVMGDSRGPAKKDPINRSELTAIVNFITNLDPKPKFVIFNGDMAFIGGTDPYDTANLDSWNGIMYPITIDPLYDDEIKLYVAIGNHELYDGKLEWYWDPAAQKWKQRKECVFFNQKNFQDVCLEKMPQNGPPGYEGLAYSFSYGDGPERSYFVVLDSFHITEDKQDERDWWYQKFLKDQRDWAEANLTANQRTPFIFVASHMPVYPVKIPRNNTLDRLWKILDSFNISAYFGAHEHLYDRCYIDWTVNAEWSNRILQIISGRAGAWDYTKVAEVTATAAPTDRVTSHNFNLVVVDVHGNQAKVQAYGRPLGDSGHGVGNYQPIDQELIIKSRTPGQVPSIVNLLLLE